LFSKLSIYLILVSLIQSQTVITVYAQERTNKFRYFERALIEEVVQLYNRAHKDTLYKIEFKDVLYFQDLFTLIDRATQTSEFNSVMAINKISITEERKKKYDFSTPYMVNKYVMLKLKERTDITEESIFKTPYRVVLTKGSIYDELTHSFDKQNTLTYSYFKSNKECAEQLKQKHADLFVSDYVDTWIYDLEVGKMLMPEFNDQLGIMFPKGSLLFQHLEKYVIYFVKSPKFYNLVRKYFGVERMKYYKRSIYSG